MPIHFPFSAVAGLLVLFANAVLIDAGAQPRPDSEWRQFRGPNGQGVSQAAGLPTTWSADRNVAWKTPLPGPGGSSPVVFGQHIYVTCYSGYAVPGSSEGELAALR